MSKEETSDLEAERIELLFERVARAMRPPKKMKPVAFDLTLAQARCLWSITRHENCTLRELSDHLGVRPSTASELVDRLVREGLVQRESDAVDRRTVRLTLTKAGRSLHRRHEAARRAHVRSYLDHLTPPQRNAMLSALETLYEVLQQAETRTEDLS